MRIAPLAIALFLAAAGLLWVPFDSYDVLYGTRPVGAVPAGEIGPSFSLAQDVRPAVAETGPGSDALQHCFAIRFATYARHNAGNLRVYWRQDRHEQQWRVAASDLVDNGYRNFCPEAAFSANRPFRIEIHGVDSKPGRSATLWLAPDTSFGSAQLSGERSQGKAVTLQSLTRQHIGPAEMARIDHGAWLIGWLCTLAIGITALIAGLGNARAADESTT